MTLPYSRFERLIFRLAATSGCAYSRIDAGAHHTPDTAPVRKYLVTLFAAHPSRFVRSDFEQVGATNFRHNPARETISFEIEVGRPIDDLARNDPTVKRAVAMLGGVIERVEECDG